MLDVVDKNIFYVQSKFWIDIEIGYNVIEILSTVKIIPVIV